MSGSTIEGYTSGGIVLSDGHLVLSDSVFKRNSAVTGAAMRVTGGHARVSACTFDGNEAQQSGGALQVDGGEVELVGLPPGAVRHARAHVTTLSNFPHYSFPSFPFEFQRTILERSPIAVPCVEV